MHFKIFNHFGIKRFHPIGKDFARNIFHYARHEDAIIYLSKTFPRAQLLSADVPFTNEGANSKSAIEKGDDAGIMRDLLSENDVSVDEGNINNDVSKSFINIESQSCRCLEIIKNTKKENFQLYIPLVFVIKISDE